MGDRLHTWLLAAALGCAILGAWVAFILFMVAALANIAAVFFATREPTP